MHQTTRVRSRRHPSPRTLLSSTSRSRAVLTLLAAALAVPVAGCADGLDRDVARIEQTIRAQPGVAAVDMRYTAGTPHGASLLPQLQLTASASPGDVAAIVRKAVGELTTEDVAAASAGLEVVADPARGFRKEFVLRTFAIEAEVLEAEARAWSTLVATYPGVSVEISPDRTPGEIHFRTPDEFHNRDVHVRTGSADPSSITAAFRSLAAVHFPPADVTLEVSAPSPADPADQSLWLSYSLRGVPTSPVLGAIEALARVEFGPAGDRATIDARWTSLHLIVEARLDETDVQRLEPAYLEALNGSNLPYELTLLRAHHLNDVLLRVAGGP